MMKTNERSMPGGPSRAKTPANEKIEIPKLRKNRKHELRWGTEYFNTLKDAVFMVEAKPYVPAVIPDKLKGDTDGDGELHVCRHCNDSFRFKSSLDNHENRKSFVLGYWCSQCFHVNCTHTQEERSMCLLCQNIENKNRARLSRRGLKRGQKMGSVQIFYNQCQLFAHLKLHSVTTIDMTYIMLMPIPSEFDNSEESHLHEACKAIMEYAFVKQKHVADILRNLEHDTKWWMSEPSDDSPVGELLKKYLIDSGDEFAEDSDDSHGDTLSRAVSPTPTDITFVDCGPTPKVFRSSKPKIQTSPPKPKIPTLPPKPKIPNSSSNMVAVFKSPAAKFSDVPTLESLKKNFKILPKNSGEQRNISPEVVSEVHVDTVKNSKMTMVKNDGSITSAERGLPIDKTTTSIPGKTEITKTAVTPSIPVSVLPNAPKISDKMIKLPPYGKLVIQNGKKYIIKPIPSGNLISKEPQKLTPNKLQPNKSRVTQPPTPTRPQPIIPQLLSPSLKNRKIQLPRSFLSSEFQNNVNPHSLEGGTKGLEVLLKKYNLDLRKKLLNYSKQRIQTIVESVTEFCKDCARSGFVDTLNIMNKNTNALRLLTGYLETASNEVMNTADQKINDDFKNRFTTWDYQKNYEICAECLKKEKPKKYFKGISKPAIPEGDYCQCYNFICHLCKSRQGNAQRFKEHLKFHNSKPPYTCPECITIFPNMQSLEIHIWTKCFHLYTQEIFACKVCEMEGFLTLEALTRHYYEVHSRSVVVCPRCPIASSTYCEHLIHYAREHANCPPSADPELLIICDFGGCLVSPENFNHHIESHREIGRIQYYTCPFCAFFKRNVIGNEHEIQDHVFMNHSERLSEIITPGTLNFFASNFNLRVERSVIKQRVKEKEMVVPKIVNACSIAPTAFEQVASQNKTTPKIIRVKTSSESVTPKVSTGGTIPRIVNVQSMNPNQAINASNPNQKYQIQALQSGKLVAVPISYLTDNLAQQRPIMLKLNLIDKNSNQVNDKVATVSSTVTKTSERVSLTLTTPKTAEGVSLTLQTPKKPESVSTLPATPVTSFSRESVLSPSTGLFHNHRSVEEHLNTRTKDPGVEPDKLIVENENLECADLFSDSEQDKPEDIIGLSPPNRELTQEERTEILRESAEALRRRGRPKKPWRIALDGSDELNYQPLNFKCHLCHENITTAWEVIKHHFAVKHYREYKLCTVTTRLERVPDSEEMETKVVECKKRKIEPTSPRGASRRKRRVGMTKIEDNSQPSFSVIQERLEQIEGNFKCKKCEQLFEDVKMLREHIANKHRIKGYYLVCLECGENFVVANSLQMHLKAFHGIVDAVSYLAQNSLYAPDIEGYLDARTAEPNQCYVCMAVFEDKSAVDKHLRVHGMAFLNHTRNEARNALKMDEKKTEVWKKPDVVRKINQHNGDDANGGSISTRILMLLS